MTREDLEHENAALKAENAALREQVQALMARVQELEGRLAKDSRNSSKPPSSDGLARKPKSLRQKSERKPGGQSGHRGSHLRLVAQPDRIVLHRPTTCGTCQAPLPDTTWAWVERRQVQELPRLRLVVTEHQITHVRCPGCGATTRGPVPDEARAPVQYGPRLRALAVYLVQQQFVPYARTRELLAEVFGAPLSVGTLVHLGRRAGEHLQAVEGQIRRRLRRAAVLHHDETGLRVVGPDGAGAGAGAGTTVDARDEHAAAHQLTHYARHPQRGAQALKAIGILPRFRGVRVHDGWMAYRPYRRCRRCRHALCNAHQSRASSPLWRRSCSRPGPAPSSTSCGRCIRPSSRRGPGVRRTCPLPTAHCPTGRLPRPL